MRHTCDLGQSTDRNSLARSLVSYADARLDSEQLRQATAAHRIFASLIKAVSGRTLGVKVVAQLVQGLLSGNESSLATQADLVREIFGNPFRSVSVEPSWLTPTVLNLARQAYEDEEMGLTPILADALQDAGCEDETLLHHLRDDRLHVPGCWALDLLRDPRSSLASREIKASGEVKRTTIAGVGPKPADLVNRNFEPTAPNRLWVADFTYVSTWAGWCYVAFVIDAYARRILGWRTATTMTADLVLDAVEQAIWVREREGRADFTALVAHHDHGSQYLSLAHSQRLTDAGITPSVGAVGSSYDNALAESINGLYKTEVIRRQGPWRDVNAVEIATARWVDWYNHRRLNEYCGDMPPAVLEQVHYAQQQPAAAN